MKITENLGEFQKFIDSDNKTGLCLEDTLKFFDIQRIFGQFESVKQSGIRVTLIMTTLLVMMFYRNRNIHSYFSRQNGRQMDRDGSKNPYYDLLGNENINWRSILYLFAKRYLNLKFELINWFCLICYLHFFLNDTNQPVANKAMKRHIKAGTVPYRVMNPFIYRLFIIIFILAYSITISAATQLDDFEFEYLGNKEGLQNMRIQSILQDHSGYIWIGTIRGLYRYNGYEMKVYKSNPLDSSSLIYHQINCIFEDSDKELWVGSMFGGLNRYSREKDNFIKVDMPARNIFCMAQDENGFLWIGTENGLFRYIKDEDKYETYHFRSSDGRRERMIQTIHCNDSETLVNIAELGIFQYDSRDNDFSPLILIEECKDFNVTNISQVYRYNDRVFWIGTDQGLLRYERGGENEMERIRDIHGTVIDSKIAFIVEESYQHIWIGADGVFRYNILENEFVQLNHQQGNSSSLASDLVYCGYKDRQDNIWIGTAGSGINIWNQSYSRFNRYPRINAELERISRDITTLTNDKEGNLWIGTRDQGLVVFDKDQNRLEYFYRQFPELQSLRSGVCEDDRTGV